jgi:hypothetical protein
MHFPVYSTDPTLTFKIGGSAHKSYMAAGCDSLPSIVTQWQNNACRGPLIAGRVEVPMRALEETLVNALDMIGYRTEYLGLYNDEKLWVRPQLNDSAAASSGGDVSTGPVPLSRAAAAQEKREAPSRHNADTMGDPQADFDDNGDPVPLDLPLRGLDAAGAPEPEPAASGGNDVTPATGKAPPSAARKPGSLQRASSRASAPRSAASSVVDAAAVDVNARSQAALRKAATA